jgi:ADP-ribose pyrophosphatase
MSSTSSSSSKRVEHTVIYTGRVFTIERDRVVLPNGQRATMDVVRHRGSVVIVPQPRPDAVILIRQFRYVIDQWIWELPAGTLEPGERPDRAARRECEEEIGLRPGEVTRLGAYYPTPGFCDERMVFYRCRRLVRPARPRAADADEDIEPRTFSLRQAWGLVKRGQIVDLKTILGLAMIAGRVPLAGAPTVTRG